ncbi:hypothetical protein GWI33_001156 [Rhynchophorus ferrugineus]|uniref:Uncharacterized protein n=1 Tax=Rhynchophorus ferrugineus TaxID=354439 RepID=A0A834MI64_RHYFE|nr:hypothetical protein GWI33_001156 [Rhynchophorus ferrugineus]
MLISFAELAEEIAFSSMSIDKEKVHLRALKGNVNGALPFAIDVRYLCPIRIGRSYRMADEVPTSRPSKNRKQTITICLR